MNKNGFVIVKAAEADAPEILRLQRVAYQSEAEIYNDYSIQPLTQTSDEALAEFQGSIVLKAVSGGRIIGSVRAHAEGDTAYIGKLMVLPEYQNKGIGKQLLTAVENECQARRYELFTGAKSEKNISLYKKCGYAIYKTEEAVPGLSFVYMEKIPVYVRDITPADYPELENFLYHAIFVPPSVEPPPRDIINHPDVFIYIDGFGDMSGDCGVVAEADSRIVGAAWERVIPAFGHIDDDTPELAISVLPEYRRRAIGTMMMTRLFELIRKRGYKQTSLAVQKENTAVRFYRRLGYHTVRESDEEFIMVKGLIARESDK